VVEDTQQVGKICRRCRQIDDAIEGNWGFPQDLCDLFGRYFNRAKIEESLVGHNQDWSIVQFSKGCAHDTMPMESDSASTMMKL
jgi:hypothetical protein